MRSRRSQTSAVCLLAVALTGVAAGCVPYRRLPFAPGVIPRELVASPGAGAVRVQYRLRDQSRWQQMTVRAVTPPTLVGWDQTLRETTVDFRTIRDLELRDGGSTVWRGVVGTGVVLLLIALGTYAAWAGGGGLYGSR